MFHHVWWNGQLLVWDYYSICMLCWKKFKDSRNWNSLCSPYSSDITSRPSFELWFEVFVNSWTVSLDHAKVHARTSRIRCWRSSKRKPSGGWLPARTIIGRCSSRKPMDRPYPKSFNFADMSFLHISHIKYTVFKRQLSTLVALMIPHSL